MIAHRPYPALLNAQRGAVLIIALVLLAIMTLLAVTAMNMNSMEERMAGNVQEINRSFQTAESGLAMAYADTAHIDTTYYLTPYASPTTTLGTYGAQVSYTAQYVYCGKPTRQAAAWDMSADRFFYFYLRSVSQTTSGITAANDEGMYEVGPSSGCVSN